jgi:hypothetical protein
LKRGSSRWLRPGLKRPAVIAGWNTSTWRREDVCGISRQETYTWQTKNMKEGEKI